MTEIRIVENDLSQYMQQLVFEDELPVVASYLRVFTDDQVDVAGMIVYAQRSRNTKAAARNGPIF